MSCHLYWFLLYCSVHSLNWVEILVWVQSVGSISKNRLRRLETVQGDDDSIDISWAALFILWQNTSPPNGTETGYTLSIWLTGGGIFICSPTSTRGIFIDSPPTSHEGKDDFRRHHRHRVDKNRKDWTVCEETGKRKRRRPQGIIFLCLNL